MGSFFTMYIVIRKKKLIIKNKVNQDQLINILPRIVCKVLYLTQTWYFSCISIILREEN